MRNAIKNTLFLFLVATFFKLGFGDLTYDDTTCSSPNSFNTYNVFQNTILYFRSPDFPKTMVNGSTSTPIVCNAKFEAKEANSQLWFIMYNGYVPSFTLTDITGYQQNFTSYNSYSDFASFIPKSNIFQFEFGGEITSKDWTAFEAIVISTPNSISDICPHGDQLIKLEENKIIPITTLIRTDNDDFRHCTWTFSINSNQNLKLVIKQYSANKASFQIKTDGIVLDTFNNEIYSSDPLVNYYGSKSGDFEIRFSTIYYSDMVAFVSVVNKNTKYPDKQCNILTNTTSIITVTNIDINNGYSAYDQCFYPINIPVGYEIFSYALDFWIENNADTVIFEEGLYQVAINAKENYFLTSKANKTFVHFQSDGNIQDAGFGLMLQTLNCQCAPSEIIIPCDGKKLITALSDTDLYCTNIQCNFQIKQNPSCSSNYFSITPYSLNLRYYDYISLYINNEFFKNFDTSDNFDHFDNIVLSPMDNVTLSFYSREVSAPIFESNSGSWSVYVQQSLMPNFISPIFLNSSLTNQVLWLNDLEINDAYSVCINESDTLELFISDAYYLGDYNLYDSKIMESFVGSLDSSKITNNSQIIPRHISSLSGCFTIYRANNYRNANAAVFFRMKIEDNKHCLSENVFNAEENGNYVYMKANSTGYCKITILAGKSYDADSSPIIALSDISVSSNATYSISSGINHKKYFDFNEFTSLDILKIYTPALDIIIPHSKSLNLTTFNFAESDLTISGKTDGFFASPSYGGFNKFLDVIYNLFSIFGLNGYTYMMMLDIISLDENSTVIISNELNNSNLTLTTTNSSISMNGTNFNLYYGEKYPGSSGFLINYSIEPIFVSTTTATTTTTTMQQVTSTTPSTTTPTITTRTTTRTSTTTTPRETSTTTTSTTSAAPSTINVTLSNDKLYYVFWLNDLSYNQALTVCSGYDLELFVSYGSDLSNYDLYDSNMQDNYVGSLDSNKITTPRKGVIPRSIMSTSKCFTVVKTNYGSQPSATLLFRMKQIQSQDCGGVANVFQTPITDQITFSVSPTNAKTCEVLILNSKAIIQISSIIAHDDAYIDIYSAVNQRKIFETNANDVAAWKNVIIYATAISLKVFGNAVFNISNSDGKIKYSVSLQKGIFVSSKYTGSSMSSVSSNYPLYQYSISSQMTQTFIVRELLDDSDVDLEIDGERNKLLKNSSIKALSNEFELYSKKDGGFLIEYNLNFIIDKTLETDTPNYVLWLDKLKPYQAMTICASSSDKLELFAGSRVDLSKYQLYDSQNFNYLVGNFSKHLTSSSGCFTLYNNGNTQATFATLIFRMTKAQSIHCTTSNVFSLDTDSPNTFSSSANSYGSCEMIILATNLPWPNLNIQSISSSSNISIALVSTINQNVIANIGVSEIGQWQNFHINTPALSVIIPASTTVTLKLNSTGRIPIIINKCVKGQKGVVASPSYNGLQQNLNSPVWFYHFQCSNVGINFNVNNMGYYTHVFIQDNNKNETFNSYSNTISSGNVEIYYSEAPTDNNYDGFLITYTFVDSSTVIYPTTPSNNPKLSLSFVYTALTIIFCCLFNQNII